MGWPSFLEDLQKLRDNLEHERTHGLIMRSSVSAFDVDSQRAALEKKRSEFIALVENIEKRVEAYLGIVTNPLFDTLASSESLMKSIEKARLEAGREKKKREAAQKELSKANDEINAYKDRVEKLSALLEGVRLVDKYILDEVEKKLDRKTKPQKRERINQLIFENTNLKKDLDTKKRLVKELRETIKSIGSTRS